MTAFGIPLQDALARSLIDPAYARPGGKPTSPASLRTGKHKPAWAWLNLPPYNKPCDVVSGSPMTIIGATVVPSPFGWEFSGNGNNHRLDIGSVPSTHPLSLFGRDSSFTLAGECYWDGGLPSNYPRFYDKSSGGGAANGYAMYVQDVGSPEFVFQVESFYQGVPVVPGRIVFVVVPGTAANEKVLHVWNGGSWKTPVSVTRAFPSATTNAAIGNWNHSTDRNWSGSISGFAVFHHNMGELLGKRVALDMWRYTLEPANDSPFVLPVTSTGGGGISVTLDAATIDVGATDLAAVLAGLAVPLGDATAAFEASGMAAALGSISSAIGTAAVEVLTSDMQTLLGSVVESLQPAVLDLTADGMTVGGGGVAIDIGVAGVDLSVIDMTPVLGTISAIVEQAVIDVISSDMITMLGAVTESLGSAAVDVTADGMTVQSGGQIVSMGEAAVDVQASDLAAVLSGVSATLGEAAIDLAATDPAAVLSGVTATLTGAVIEALASGLGVTVGVPVIDLGSAEIETTAGPMAVVLSLSPIILGDAAIDLYAASPSIGTGDFLAAIGTATITVDVENMTVTVTDSCTSPQERRLFDRADLKRNNSLLRVFGETVEFTALGLSVKAVYVRGGDRVPVAGLNPREARDRIVCKTTDVCSYGIDQGESVTVRGATFTVTGDDPGINGMTTFYLRRVN